MNCHPRLKTTFYVSFGFSFVASLFPQYPTLSWLVSVFLLTLQPPPQEKLGTHGPVSSLGRVLNQIGNIGVQDPHSLFFLDSNTPPFQSQTRPFPKMSNQPNRIPADELQAVLQFPRLMLRKIGCVFYARSVRHFSSLYCSTPLHRTCSGSHERRPPDSHTEERTLLWLWTKTDREDPVLPYY